jgi:thioredoxin 1
MAGNVIEVGDTDFAKEVLQADSPVLVDFTASWCAPCRAIAPVLDTLAGEWKGRMKVTKLDVDANMRTAEAYGVRSMPTLLFFKGGRVVQQIVGAVPRAKLEEAFQKVTAG